MFEKDTDIMSGKGEWDEAEHPRDSDGKFTSKGGGQSTTSQSKREKESEKKDAYQRLATTLKKIAESKLKVSKPKMADLVNKIMNFEPIKLNIGDREILAEFDKYGAKKIVWGKSENEKDYDRKIKLKNIDNLPQYIKTSTYLRSAAEEGKTTDAHKGVKEWHYFINELDTNKGKFNIQIDIRDKGKNQYVYFVTFKRK
ncbi:MAG: hypothetical protein IJX25_00235 [Clostridia bacterium]|nr:hypothetical protein [Clostridia bacterium]